MILQRIKQLQHSMQDRKADKTDKQLLFSYIKSLNGKSFKGCLCVVNELC